MGVFSVALVLSAGCQDKIDDVQTGNDSGLVASIEDIRYADDTKTRLSVNDVMCWVSGDKVNVNGTSLTVYPLGTNATSATLSGTAAANASGVKYYGYYPVTAGWWDAAKNRITLPESRTFNPANPMDCVPMYAESDNGYLEFKNPFALLEISLTGYQAVTSIKLTSTAGNLSGTFIVGETSFWTVSGTKTVTLTCPTGGVKLDPSRQTRFWVAVPPGTFTNLRIDIYTDMGGEINKTMAGFTAKRGVIHTFAFNAKPKGVQFWENGPYFATTWVGATSPTGVGAKFMYGSSKPIAAASETTEANWRAKGYDTVVYTEKTDPVTVAWGKPWRMPTLDEMNKLFNQKIVGSSVLSSGYYDRYTITGTGTGFTGNSIVFKWSWIDYNGTSYNTNHYLWGYCVNTYDMSGPTRTCILLPHFSDKKLTPQSTWEFTSCNGWYAIPIRPVCDADKY